MRWILLVTLSFVSLLLAMPALAHGDVWTIRSFAAEYSIAADGAIRVQESIEADFGSLQRHGIFRDLTTDIICSSFQNADEETSPCPDGSNRHYQLQGFEVTSVESDGNSSPIRWELITENHGVRLKIGDPDRFVTGIQRYRVSYTLVGALDALTTADQFFWNVSGVWETSILNLSATVRLLDGIEPVSAVCYQGDPAHSRQCETSPARVTVFQSSNALPAGDELTVRLTWPKDTIAIPPPLYSKDRTWRDYFTLDLLELGTASSFSLIAIVIAGAIWMTGGRDRRFTTIHYLTGDTTERTKGVLEGEDIVVEYAPPEDLRPAQLAMVIDERATPRDVTATIVDLAARGYIQIEEYQRKRRLARDKPDWWLRLTKPADEELLPYESKLLTSIFARRKKPEVRVSALARKFTLRMEEAKKGISADAIGNGWFRHAPGSVRRRWLGAGVGIVVLGVALAGLFGFLFDRALLGAPIVVMGIGIAVVSGFMPRRTAAGAEIRRRALGFKLYIETAEQRQHEFNEERGLFPSYLPYAIAFDCVDRWATAFKRLAESEGDVTPFWYTGVRPFDALAFGVGMNQFSSAVSSSLSQSASGSSGGSVGGFGGGGGGGGGGGSW